MRGRSDLTGAKIDQGWPHQVALPASFTVPNFRAIGQFCAKENLSLSRLGHSFYRDGQHHNVYCFADPEHAERFRARFGGELIAPKDRPKRGRGS